MERCEQLVLQCGDELIIDFPGRLAAMLLLKRHNGVYGHGPDYAIDRPGFKPQKVQQPFNVNCHIVGNRLQHAQIRALASLLSFRGVWLLGWYRIGIEFSGLGGNLVVTCIIYALDNIG